MNPVANPTPIALSARIFCQSHPPLKVATLASQVGGRGRGESELGSPPTRSPDARVRERGERERRERERERGKRLRALRPPRGHTLGYIGVGDQIAHPEPRRAGCALRNEPNQEVIFCRFRRSFEPFELTENLCHFTIAQDNLRFG